jgi:hypothetical protein
MFVVHEPFRRAAMATTEIVLNRDLGDWCEYPLCYFGIRARGWMEWREPIDNFEDLFWVPDYYPSNTIGTPQREELLGWKARVAAAMKEVKKDGDTSSEDSWWEEDEECVVDLGRDCAFVLDCDKFPEHLRWVCRISLLGDGVLLVRMDLILVKAARWPLDKYKRRVGEDAVARGGNAGVDAQNANDGRLPTVHEGDEKDDGGEEMVGGDDGNQERADPEDEENEGEVEP